MRKVILSTMVGNGLEWYDYALYAYSTLIISKLFFPEGNETAHLLATFGIFAVGFIARPFGGIFFGIIGDKFGRRKALVLAIMMMAIPTGCIGLLPTYEMIGIWAPILLVLIRIFQGLSLGGEFSGSMTFLVEHAPPGKRALIGSTAVVSLIIGFLTGSFLCFLIKLSMSDVQYETWGWRIPFILGMGIGFIGFYIREHCVESPRYVIAKEQGALASTPVRDVLKHELPHVFQAIGIYITVTMPFYLVSAYFIAFTEHTLGRSKDEALMLNTINMLILLIMSLASAWASDLYGRRKVLIAAAVASLLLVYPLFGLVLSPDFTSILLGQALLAIVVGSYLGPVPALLVEIFPTRLRYTGMAMSYNISAALFGGTAPMVCQWLVSTTGNNYSIVYYVMLCNVVSLVALYFYRDRHNEPLR
jgi:MFS transporter, MHS family, proline/betaine transporter